MKNLTFLLLLNSTLLADPKFSSATAQGKDHKKSEQTGPYLSIEEYDAVKAGLIQAIVYNTTYWIRRMRIAINSNYFPQKRIFKDFLRKADYDRGILKDIEPDVKETIRKELQLTDWQMQNLVFLVDTSDHQISAHAHVSDGNVIVFSQEMYRLARKGLDGDLVKLSWDAKQLKGRINVKIPPRVALDMFLYVCSHEIEHIKRFLVYPVPSFEKKADEGCRDKHLRGAYIYARMCDIITCYESEIDDTIKMLLVTDGKKRKDEFTIRSDILENHSEELFYQKRPNALHPSPKKMAAYFKKRGQKLEEVSTEKSSKTCAQFTVSKKGILGISQVLKTLEVCTSFIETVR